MEWYLNPMPYLTPQQSPRLRAATKQVRKALADAEALVRDQLAQHLSTQTTRRNLPETTAHATTWHVSLTSPFPAVGIVAHSNAAGICVLAEAERKASVGDRHLVKLPTGVEKQTWFPTVCVPVEGAVVEATPVDVLEQALRVYVPGNVSFEDCVTAIQFA